MRTWLRSKVTLLFMTLGMLVAIPAVALASDVDVTSVVDVTGPTGAVTLQPGQSGPIKINMSVTGSQAGTATFEVNRNWELQYNSITDTYSFVGSNPQEFTVGPRAGGDPANTFSADGTVSVASGVPAGGPRILTVGVFDITNTNTTGAKLEAGDSATYAVTVAAPSDTTAPKVTAIARTTTSPTNTTGNLSWNVTFSENVTGVERSDFQLATTGLGGSPAILADPNGVTGSGANYTVTASSGTGDGTLGLNLVDDNSIKDGANNLLVGASSADGSFTGEVYTIDRTAPVVTLNKLNGSTTSFPYVTNQNVSSVGGSCTTGDGPVSVTLGGNATDPATATCSSGSWTLDLTTELSSEGTYNFAASQTDQATNTGSSGSNQVKIDKTGPNAPTLSFNTSANQSDSVTVGSVVWYKDSVLIDVAANGDPLLADNTAGSGVNAASLLPNPFTYSTNGSTTASKRLSDNAGNEGAQGTLGVNVDAEDPTVSITGCPTADVIQGSTKTIDVSASDGESGLATDPTNHTFELNTGTIGQQTASFKAVDRVGHEEEASCTYNVIFDFSGFFQPIDNKDPNTGNYIPNKAKAGSVIPVKFSLGGDQGLDIFYTADPMKVYPTVVGATGCATGTADLVEQYAPANASGLKYDPLANQYIYNWKTQSSYVGKCLMLNVKLADGETYSALFTFTK